MESNILSLPKVIVAAVKPFLKNKWLNLFRRIEEDEEALETYGMYEIIKSNFSEWRSPENIEAFFKQQTEGLRQEVPMITDLLEKYYTSYFQVLRACRGLSNKTMREMQLERPSLSAFVRSVYIKNMREILNNTRIIGTDDEEDFLDDMINSTVSLTLDQMVPVKSMFDTLQELQSACTALQGKEVEDEEEVPPEDTEEVDDEKDSTTPIPAVNALSSRYPKKFKRGANDLITYNKGNLSMESLENEIEDEEEVVDLEDVNSSMDPDSNTLTDYPSATSTPKDLLPSQTLQNAMTKNAMTKNEMAKNNQIVDEFA